MALAQERLSNRLYLYDSGTEQYLDRHPKDAELVDRVVSELLQTVKSFPITVELLEDSDEPVPTLAVDIVAGDKHDEARALVNGFRRLHPDEAPSGARLCYGVVHI